MRREEFVESVEFKKGTYQVFAVPREGGRRRLLTLQLQSEDAAGARHVPRITCDPSLDEADKRLVFSALVRAGAQHPGLRDEDLRRLHALARKENHVELFTDLNALTTGLASYVVRSLGTLVGRLIISSSSIDILHEYQSRYRRGGEFLKRAEMARALRILDELRRLVPVHVHQLPPGTSRYFPRTGTTAGDETGAADELTFTSEDRQMIGAFWDYLTSGNPRLPVRLLTSDFSLAHVCFAERLPFVFARSPFEAWREGCDVQALWFDPFALVLRACIPHSILWELCQIYATINVIKDDEPEDDPNHFSLAYDHRNHLPGEPEETIKGRSSLRGAEPAVARRSPQTRTKVAASRDDASSSRRIKLSLLRVLDVLPTSRGQRIPLEHFKPRDSDSLRQLKQIGELTALFEVGAEAVSAGPSIEELLNSLNSSDYIAVNALFRRHPVYDQMLQAAAGGTPFPNSKTGGAMTGWAIILGAAYKVSEGSVLFGLNPVSEERFEQAVVRFHAETSRGQAAAPLPAILDMTCRALRLSPIRFESILATALGSGALKLYELQRATVDGSIPSHPVLTFPSTASPQSYIRMMEPGKGIMVERRLLSSLVRRTRTA